MFSKFSTKTLLAPAIFFVSIFAYYYPVLQKGYAPGANYEALMGARNFALAGTYKVENSIGTLLASENASQFGAEKGILNPLTQIIYGRIFKYLGFRPELPLYMSIVLFALFNVLIFLLSARLFGTVIGFVSGLAGAFMPTMTVGAIHGGFYEWGIIFFGLALWVYLGAKNGPFKAGSVRVLVVSVFFALAALSRNAFAISFVPFFLYDLLINRSYKRALIFLLPFLIIFGSTLTSYSWLGVPNGYTADIERQSFGLIGHFFPDPYTFYYNRDNFVITMKERGLIGPAVLFATKWGYRVSLFEMAGAYWNSFSFYVKEAVNLTSTGGPFILGLMLLGLINLYRLNKKILGLFVSWGIIWFGYLVYAKTGNWDHLMEVVLIFSILVSLGLAYLAEIIGMGTLKKTIISLIIFILFAGHMAYANKWRLHDIYRSSNEEEVLNIAKTLSRQNRTEAVYAIGIHPNAPYSLNYRTDYEVVYFDSETIKELITNKKLKTVFDAYNIGSVLGYGEETTKQIKSQVPVQSIP